MLRNFLLIVVRNMAKHKVYALINILGLALWMAAFLIIISYVRYEYSFDQMFTDVGHIYRVESQFYKNDQKTDDWPTSTNGYGPAMKANFPEIEAYTRINWHNKERVVRYQDIKFREENVCYADSNFFEFFSYPVLKGNPGTFLKEPNTIVISASAAKKYFGNADPIGKFLDISTIDNTMHCMVTGVFADVPGNSTMQFDFLMSWLTSPEWMRDFWYLHESYTFVKLRPKTDINALQVRFPALAEKYKTGPALKDLKWTVSLVPMTQIHLNSVKPYEIETKGNRKAVKFLTIMAFMILVIGWINYINLSTARAMDRAREVGIRKVTGSRKGMLVFQILFEAMFINFIALVIALILLGLSNWILPVYLGESIASVHLDSSDGLSDFRGHFCCSNFIIGYLSGHRACSCKTCVGIKREIHLCRWWRYLAKEPRGDAICLVVDFGCRHFCGFQADFIHDGPGPGREH